VNQQLILLLVVMAALFYLLIYRPQARAKRQREELDRSLEVGREVVTIGGLHGEIVAIDAETADVEIADGVVVTFERRAISATARPQGEGEEDEDLDEDDEDLDDLDEDEALDDEALGDEADEIDPEAVADAAHGDEGASSDGDAGRPA
jgi:preprotein translocase subunit YajC